MHHATVDGGPAATFRVTDGKSAIDVSYSGILPDLFREGQGVVAVGTLAPDHSFRAQEVLAKHDEKYMPKDVADALKKRGYWKDRTTGAGVMKKQGRPGLCPGPAGAVGPRPHYFFVTDTYSGRWHKHRALSNDRIRSTPLIGTW